jgi:hypothetical protein
MSYISNKLTHWVGRNEKTDEDRYNILFKNILKKKELRYGKCDWLYGSKYGGIIKPWKVEMICFTDIPYSETESHCKEYSKFGLSFEKSYLANCMASPVGYEQHPLLHQNFSFIVRGLEALKGILKKNGLEKWSHPSTKEERPDEFSLQDIIHRFNYNMIFRENYSKKEFVYNENSDVPYEDQLTFFEEKKSSYTEREWRMVISSSGSQTPWIIKHDNYHYFCFNDRFLYAIIVPRSFINRLNKDLMAISSSFIDDRTPLIIPYEDLRFF